ncbi:hypothetical protein KQI63_02275 [bacterium]|nr:hypothetical protein [bacterium]
MIQNTRRALSFLLLTAGLSGLIPTAAYAFDGYIAGDVSQTYTPTTGPFAPSEQTHYIPLSGEWRLSTPRGDESYMVNVPGNWPANNGPANLSTTFKVPDDVLDQHLMLVLWGARRQLSIKINDRLIEAWEADWPTVVVDIPHGLLREGKSNDLLIEVEGKLSARESIPLKPKLFDERTYAGVFSDVAIVASPTISIEGLDWDVRFSNNYSHANWEITADLRNQSPPSADTTAGREFSLYTEWVDPVSGTTGRSETVIVQLGAVEISQVTLTGQIRNPKLWSLDSPVRHRFNLVFEEMGKSWRVPYSLGLRELEWTNDGIKLNGNTIAVRGIDYRRENLEHGISMSPAEIEADLVKMKKLGFNLIRIIGEPPHPATPEICDRLGLLLVPTTGLRGVPEGILTSEAFRDRVSKMILANIERDHLHPSIVAWNVIDWAPATPSVLNVLESLRDSKKQLDSRPLMAGFATNQLPDLPNGVVGLRQRPPYQLFEPLAPTGSPDDPWLIGGLGSFATRTELKADSVRGQVQQADALLHQLKAIRTMPVAGFVIDGYSDRYASLPMMISGAEAPSNKVRRGLLNSSRDQRIAWQKVGEAFGLIRIEAPTLELPRSDFPILFPIATMIIGGILLLTMRQNNVFRHNLQRVFAHTHGFFVDIRDRRYFQSGQTLLVAFIFASSQAVFTASWLHHSKFDFSLDYFITLLFPFSEVKQLLVVWAWQPLHGILAFTAIYFLLLLVLAFLIRIVALPFKGSISMRQSFSLVSWASSSFLILLPLGLVHYRFLDYQWFTSILPFLAGMFWLWFVIRLATIIRIGYRVTIRSSWFILILGVLILAGTALMLYRSGFAIMDYIDYYRTVILPWDVV